MHLISRLAALGICAAAVAACQRAESRSAEPDAMPTGEVAYQDPHLGRSAALAIAGPYLVVADDYADSVVQIVDRRSGRLVRSLGRKGAGPGEFKAPWRFASPAGRPGELWLYDMGLMRLTRIPLPNDAGAGAQRISIPLPQLPLTAPVWAGDSLLLSPGIFGASARIARIAPSGRLIGYAGPPPPGPSSTPMMVRQHAYQATAAFSPARGLLVLADRHADRLELYRNDGTPVRTIVGRNGFAPVYAVGTHGGAPAMVTGENLRFGYVDVAATGDAIYALYSGRTRREFPGRASLAGEVHVYGWDGRLRRILPLDADVSRIAVDSAAAELYAVRSEPTPAVLRYRIPAERRAAHGLSH
ncbi:MAG TPA: BF3164 family lipoprotein [Longimicrobium sp.]